MSPYNPLLKPILSADHTTLANLVQKLDNNANLIREPITHGDTLLHYAARAGDVTSAEILLKAGANISAINDKGRQPIHEGYAFPQLLQCFLNYHADPNALKNGSFTPLMLAASHPCHTESVKILLSYHATPSLKNSFGWTALYIASKEGCTESVRALVHADPSTAWIKNRSGRLPLHAACASGYLECAKILLLQGNKDQNTYYTSDSNHTQNIITPITTSTTPTNTPSSISSSSALNTSMYPDHHNIIPFTETTIEEFHSITSPIHIQHSNQNQDQNQDHQVHNQDPENFSIFYDSSFPPSNNVLVGSQSSQILPSERMIDSTDTSGFTPLHDAAANGNIHLIQYLITEWNASIEIQDKLGRTPLMISALTGKNEAVFLLCELGSNVFAVDQFGQHCLHYATKEGWIQVVYVLKKRKEWKDLRLKLDFKRRSAKDLGNLIWY